jgi:DNA-directed RNA polymerase omega subunit
MRKAISIDDIYDRFPNKYEVIIVMAREARRLNELGRTLPPEERERAGATAFEKALRGEVRFSYRKKVRPRPWPEMAGPEVLEMRQEPVAAAPATLWKDEEEEPEPEQEDSEEEPGEEHEEAGPEADEPAEPSVHQITAADLPEDSVENAEDSAEDESDD